MVNYPFLISNFINSISINNGHGYKFIIVLYLAYPKRNRGEHMLQECALQVHNFLIFYLLQHTLTWTEDDPKGNGEASVTGRSVVYTTFGPFCFLISIAIIYQFESRKTTLQLEMVGKIFITSISPKSKLEIPSIPKISIVFFCLFLFAKEQPYRKTSKYFPLIHGW